MKKLVELTIKGNPMGKQRPKFSTIHGFTQTISRPETVNYENLVKLLYNQKYGEMMFDENDQLSVLITANFSIPKTISKKQRALMLQDDIRPTKKPDCDNIAKIVLDALNNIAFPDDKQVVSLNVNKFYSEEPSVRVSIWVCGQKDEEEEED